MSKRALITGISGQDGHYLSELLLSQGYEVHGLTRRPPSVPDPKNPQVLHHADLDDGPSLIRVIKLVEPDEIYNLGAQSHVSLSFDQPEHTAQTDALGPLRILEAVRLLGLAKVTRVFQASTSELFGKVAKSPQTESTPFHPVSPYGVAKLYAHSIAVNYREAYGMFACNGILYRHDSPRRPASFVSRKVTQGVARIATGQQDRLLMGNIEVRSDWGHARDFVRAMALMLGQDAPDDYIVATGEQHSVREFITGSFAVVGIGLEWKGDGMDEVGIDGKSGKALVQIDPSFFRPSDPGSAVGDASRARSRLGWKPTTSFSELIEEMVEADLGISKTGNGPPEKEGQQLSNERS